MCIYSRIIFKNEIFCEADTELSYRLAPVAAIYRPQADFVFGKIKN